MYFLKENKKNIRKCLKPFNLGVGRFYFLKYKKFYKGRFFHFLSYKSYFLKYKEIFRVPFS